MTSGPHYARLDCRDCGKFVKWAKKPAGQDIHKTNNYTGGKNMTINEVIIAGRLTKSPELKYTTGNIAVCKFSVALDRYMGEGKEKATDFINLTAWREQAEFISKYFDKGSKIIIKGNLKQNVWEDKEGKKHYDTEVWVEKSDFADSKKESSGDNGSDAKTNANNNTAPPSQQPQNDFYPPLNDPPADASGTVKKMPWE